MAKLTPAQVRVLRYVEAEHYLRCKDWPSSTVLRREGLIAQTRNIPGVWDLTPAGKAVLNAVR